LSKTLDKPRNQYEPTLFRRTNFGWSLLISRLPEDLILRLFDVFPEEVDLINIKHNHHFPMHLRFDRTRIYPPAGGSFNTKVKMMDCKFTVFFDPPFWVGIVEIIENNQCRAVRHIFGAEPTDPELLNFALQQYSKLEFTRSVSVVANERHPVNYKRQMREIRAQMDIPQKSTRAQDIIRQEYELKAVEQKKITKVNNLQEEDRKYRLKKARQIEKHRGH
jgi:hypothetical protein